MNNDKVEYIVQLGNNKKPALKSIGRSDTLKGANDIKNKRRIMPNQTLWIGKYVNGILKESF